MSSIAQFANDSFHLSRMPYSLRRKAGLWANLLRRSGRFQGFDVQYLDRASYVLLYREMFAHQQYYFKSPTEPPLIFDCGANIGIATVFFKWLYPQSKIHSFEPDPTTFSVLERNISANHLPCVTAHNCALCDEEMTIPFFVHPSVKGSLRMSANVGRLDETEAAPGPESPTLQLYYRPIDLLKLDVEGGSCVIWSPQARSN